MAFGVIKNTILGLQPSTVTNVAESPHLPTPAASAHQAVTSMPAQGEVARSTRNSANPCHEVIDWQSGTYIDHCAQRAPSKPPSAAEQRELQRKADEAYQDWLRQMRDRAFVELRLEER